MNYVPNVSYTLREHYPSVNRMFHHCKNSIVKFVIVNEEHDLFSMQCRFFTGTNDFRNINPRPKELEMFHGLLRFVFRIENCEFGEHGHMSTFKTKASFHQCNEFVEESIVLVLLNQFLQFLGVDNQIKTTNLSETEFSLVDTCLVDMFPNPVC